MSGNDYGRSMTKKIDILGLALDNYTVRESITQAEAFLENDMLNIIETISMKMLIGAEEHPAVRGVIEASNLVIIGEKEILQSAGIDTMQRIHETEENDFAVEFFKRLERNRKSIFLLGQSGEQIAREREDMLKVFPRLVIVGEYALENCVGDTEAVINDMNVMTPDVIVSILPSPLQEEFFWNHKDKMNASIWYGEGELGLRRKRNSVIGFLGRLAYRGRLKSSIEKYRQRLPEAERK